MIKNKRDLANRLDNEGRIELTNVSKALNKVIQIWISSGDVKLNNNTLIGNF